MKSKTIFLLMMILALGFILRIYNLEKVVGFDWDQEQTALAAKRILTERRPTLVGMETGHGGILMGSGYYYLFSLPYLLFRMDPIGAPIFAVWLSLLTNFLIFYIGRKCFSSQVGLLASFIYAVSNYLIRFDQSVWSANVVMLISLLTFLALFKIKEGKSWGIYLLGFCLGSFFHTHFTLVFLFPITLLAFVFIIRKLNVNLKQFGIFSLLILLFLSPLVIFDLRHRFLNSQAVLRFFLERGKESLPLFDNFWQKLQVLVGSSRSILVEGKLPVLDLLTLLLLILLTIQVFSLRKQNKARESLRMIFLFLAVPTLFYSFYQGPFSNYYFLLSYPFFIMAVSYYFFQFLELFQRKQIRLLVGLLIIGIFLLPNAEKIANGEKNLSAFSLKNKREVVKFIIQKNQGQPFRISYTTKLANESGFSYLFAFYKAKITQEKTAPIFTIVIPSNYHQINSWYHFGDIGVVGPRYD